MEIQVNSDISKEDYLSFYTMCNTIAKQFLLESRNQANGEMVNLEDYRITFLLEENGAGVLRFRTKEKGATTLWTRTVLPQISSVEERNHAVKFMSVVQAKNLDNVLRWSDNVRKFLWDDVYDTICLESERRYGVIPYVEDLTNHVQFIQDNEKIVGVDYICFHFRTTRFTMSPSDLSPSDL